MRTLKWFLLLALLAVLAAAGGATLHVRNLDAEVSARFEGKRWALPTQVYARPLELYEGRRLTRGDLVEELERLGYQRSERIERAGSFRIDGDRVEVATRGFVFFDGAESARKVGVRFVDGRIDAVEDLATTEPVILLRLDPATIGSIYPRHGEDRVLVRLDAVPTTLTDALLAVEDRHFHRHRGVRPQSLLRALWANLRAGGVVQGGSTITQQLVKNFYLDNRRTLRRKLDEAVMALLLEWRYDKDEILEAYLNEIYLGQDGDRAVHGFGLGSQFYFQRPITELNEHEIALLVAIIRGPSFYDPRRHPERAQARRDLVLAQMRERDVLSQSALDEALARPLGVVDRTRQTTRYPAFMGLVQRQLRDQYRPEDLMSEGLRIFTTVDPALQARVEAKVTQRLAELERQRDMPARALEAAVVVTDTDSGEVLALVGGRDGRFAGFNRALDARRPVGSLVKPYVHLAALEQSSRYHAAKLIEDGPMTVPLPGGRSWEPRNFDRQWHGPVPMYRALTESYNAATVRIGMDVGVDAVIDVLARAGLATRPPPHPSLLLGALELSPVEVADLYQTLATGGFRVPPRAIREVTTAEGLPLSRYPLSLSRGIEPDLAYLTNRLLQETVRDGTGRRAGATLPADWRLAGKTGTSDGLRDSWFAGFGGDRLAVVWVGRDDNEPAALTGATGALPLWMDVMAEIGPRPLDLRAPERVREYWVDAASGEGSGEGCPGAVRLPFLEGTAPDTMGPCGERIGRREAPEQPGLLRRIRDLFGG